MLDYFKSRWNRMLFIIYTLWRVERIPIPSVPIFILYLLIHVYRTRILSMPCVNLNCFEYVSEREYINICIWRGSNLSKMVSITTNKHTYILSCMSLANENISCWIESDAHKVIFTACIYDNTILCTIP